MDSDWCEDCLPLLELSYLPLSLKKGYLTYRYSLSSYVRLSFLTSVREHPIRSNIRLFGRKSPPVTDPMNALGDRHQMSIKWQRVMKLIKAGKVALILNTLKWVTRSETVLYSSEIHEVKLFLYSLHTSARSLKLRKHSVSFRSLEVCQVLWSWNPQCRWPDLGRAAPGCHGGDAFEPICWVFGCPSS